MDEDMVEEEDFFLFDMEWLFHSDFPKARERRERSGSEEGVSGKEEKEGPVTFKPIPALCQPLSREESPLPARKLSHLLHTAGSCTREC